MMDRRSAFKCFLVISAGVTMLPSCLQQKGRAAVSLKHIMISREDETMLEAMAALMIPATGTPGAKEVGAHRFALTMIDDCCNTETQHRFMDGMRRFNILVTARSGRPFLSNSPVQQQQWLIELEAGKGMPAAVLAFYQQVKQLIIEGFISSHYYLTEVRVYELVPARFDGCVPVTGS